MRITRPAHKETAMMTRLIQHWAPDATTWETCVELLAALPENY